MYLYPSMHTGMKPPGGGGGLAWEPLGKRCMDEDEDAAFLPGAGPYRACVPPRSIAGRVCVSIRSIISRAAPAMPAARAVGSRVRARCQHISVE